MVRGKATPRRRELMADRTKLVATIVFAAGLAAVTTTASAMPVADALAIKKAAPAAIESVQWRRGWGWRGGGGWGGAAAGFVAGAVLGSALTAPYYYGYGPAPYYPQPTTTSRRRRFTDRRGPATARRSQTRPPIARSGSRPGIPPPEPISVTTASGIPAPERAGAIAGPPPSGPFSLRDDAIEAREKRAKNITRYDLQRLE